MNPALLAVFAHPDDESFGTGGTLAKYATNGTREILGAVREAELRCAARRLGVHEIRFLGYRDSGMAGAAEKEEL